MDEIRSQVQTSLRTLINQGRLCKIDLPFARELAQAERLDPAQVLVAARLLRSARLETFDLLDDLISWAVEQHDALNLDDLEEALSLDRELAEMAEPPLVEEDIVRASEEGTPIKRVSVQDSRIIVEFPYDRAKVAALQPLKETIEGWAFDRSHRKEWSYPMSAAWSVFQALRGFHDLSYTLDAIGLIMHQFRLEALERRIQTVEERWRMLSQLAALEAARPYLDGAPVANGQRLFRHQREAVQRMIEARRFILAHEMGLGKSRSSLLAAHAFDLPIWVVAPTGTQINWQREAEAAGVPITLFSWAKLPEPPEDLDFALIVDEAHFSQAGEGSQRGRAFLQLAASARVVYLLTGTPAKNGLPINLYPLLVAVQHPLAADRRFYEDRYCNAQIRSIGRKRAVRDISGASNLDELHEYTRDVILYKKKSECLDLPEKLRVLRQAEVTEASQIIYQQALDVLHAEHQERMADEALRAGRDVLLGDAMEESDTSVFLVEEAASLVELGIHRHAASLAKVESAGELAQEALEQGQAVLLFCAYRASAERLASKLRGDCSKVSREGESRRRGRVALVRLRGYLSKQARSAPPRLRKLPHQARRRLTPTALAGTL